MKRHVFWAILVLFAFAAVETVAAQSVEEILSKLDANMSYGTASFSARMQITVGSETRYKTVNVVSQGSSKSFAEFTNPEDRGTRMLKLGDNLWIYFPEEQGTVKLSGYMLRQGMMGSDVSYQDVMESSDFLAKYTGILKGQETVDGRPAFVVELAAKVPTAAYDRRVLWIDSERFVPLKQEMHAKSGLLLKTTVTTEVTRVDDRWFPARMEYVSKLHSDTKTVFAMSNIEFGIKLGARQFSLSALQE